MSDQKTELDIEEIIKLRPIITAFLQSVAGTNGFALDFNPTYDRYRDLLRMVQKASGDTDFYQYVEYIGTKVVLGGGFYPIGPEGIAAITNSGRQLIAYIDDLLRVHRQKEKEGKLSITSTREGIFFAGEYFDALDLFSNILSEARKEIIMIDGYINKSILNLLTAKDNKVSVRILTSSSSMTPALRTAAEVFNKQYKNLSIRISEIFHDRWVVIDDTDFYHFGASFKDLGNKGFMFSRMEEPDVIKALRVRWNQEWAKAKIEV